jgi:16S rRNA (guanine527-N7)-methyltransferase
MMNISQEDVREGLTATRAPAEAARRIAPVMQRYAIALGEDNDRFGLIGREDAASPARILQRHILDSLAPWRILADLVAESGRRRLYDLGTGPGLPGIPLAFLLRAADVPLTETVLVERRGKRVTFLMGVVPALQARLSETSPDLTVTFRTLEADADSLRSREGGALDDGVVVFRAYRPTTAEFLVSLAATFGPGAPVCALKGRMESAREELRLLEESGYAVDPQVHELVVPGLAAERTVLVWRTGDASVTRDAERS